MASYLESVVTDQNGVPVAGANVYIYRSPDGLADLEDSLGQVIDNPVVTDDDGYWKAYVDDGYYTARFFWGGRQRYVEANWLAGDPPVGPNADPNLRLDLADEATGIDLVGGLRGRLDGIELTPERFGATGDPDDDQTVAMAAMMAVARTAGKATIRLTEGSTYTSTNPFIWGGVRELTIEGWGAKVMNARTTASGTSDVNTTPFNSPRPMLTNGTDIYVSGLDIGFTVASAAAGATALTATSGTPTVGWAWIYGWDRYGDGGAPPTPVERELIYVKTVAGSAMTLATPLLNSYDANAPDLIIDGTQQAGVARVIMLDRAAGTYAANVWMEKLSVYGVEFIGNPLLSASVPYEVAGFGGARFIHLEGVKAPKMSISQCEHVTIKGGLVTSDLEVDKMVGEVILDGADVYNLLGGIGCEVLRFRNQTKVRNNIQLAPTKLMHIEPNGLWLNAVNAFVPPSSSRYLFGNYAYGSAKCIIDSCEIAVSNVNSDRLMEAGNFTWTPTTIATTTLGSSRADWDNSNWGQQARVGSIIYAGNIPVAEITSLPTVPSGTKLRTITTSPAADNVGSCGAVQIGIKLLGGSIAGGTALKLPVIADVEVRAWPKLTGPYARQVQDALGADATVIGDKLANIVTPSMRATKIEIDFHKLVEFYGSGLALKSLGRVFVATQIDVHVTRAAVDAGAVGLFLGADTSFGASIGIIGSVDLKTTGRSTLVQSASSGLTGMGATVLGGTFTVTIATPGVVTATSHGMSANQRVHLRTTGALPTGLTALTTYYIRNPTADTFELSATSGGASIATSGGQSGVHSIYGLPIDPLVALRVFDASRTLTEGNRAAGKIIVKGYRP